MTVTGSREALLHSSLKRQCDNMAFVLNHAGLPQQWYDKLCLELQLDRVALSPDPAGVTLTVEEIARIIRSKMQDDCGRFSAKPEWIAEAATAILSLIQSKMVQPSIATKPATSGTADPKLSGSPRWPRAGDRMTFLGENGYDYELQAAMKIFEVGAEYTVRGCDVGDWRHTISFEGKPGHFNGVMFAQLSTDAPSASDPSLQAEPLLTHPPFNKGNEPAIRAARLKPDQEERKDEFNGE